METYKLVVPTVHSNGTSSEELLSLREEFYSKLRDAETALRHMAPNGRDYYLTPGMFERAVIQHTRRMGMLKMLFDEIEKECEEINKQV